MSQGCPGKQNQEDISIKIQYGGGSCHCRAQKHYSVQSTNWREGCRMMDSLLQDPSEHQQTTYGLVYFMYFLSLQRSHQHKVISKTLPKDFPFFFFLIKSYPVSPRELWKPVLYSLSGSSPNSYVGTIKLEFIVLLSFLGSKMGWPSVVLKQPLIMMGVVFGFLL